MSKVSVDVKADTNAAVNAPVLTRNNITGPVNINYTSYTAGASVHPKEGIPNFLKVIRDEEQNTVRTAVIEKDELDQINPKKDELRLPLKSDEDKAAFFDKNYADLIQRVTNVKIIADQLLQQKMIHQELYSEITHDTLTSADSMRKLCSDIRHRNIVTVKAKLITILQNEKLYDFITSV